MLGSAVEASAVFVVVPVPLLALALGLSSVVFGVLGVPVLLLVIVEMSSSSNEGFLSRDSDVSSFSSSFSSP